MKMEFELLPPNPPSFIAYRVPAMERQDGFNANGTSIPVGSLTEQEANEYGELMKMNFLNHWMKRRAEFLNQNQTK